MIYLNKKKLKWIILMLGLVFALHAFGQDEKFVNLNGYLQTRLSSNFDNSTEFTIRRAKLWVYGEIPNLSFITYKMQAVYTSFKSESFVFQDAFADIHTPGYGYLRVGRFVPDFMLQRMQPDYEIPVLERADVISDMTINEKEMGREVGLQYTFQHKSLPLHFSFGIFNANVEQPAHSKDNLLLYTSRVAYKVIDKGNSWLDIGGSFAYRHLDKMTLTTIYQPDSVISGNDFRWGIESQWHWNNFELQGEYVQAKINKDKADGWYALADYTIHKKYQVVALAQKYNDLNPITSNNAWYGVGFNVQLSGNTKLMSDLKTQDTDSGRKYLGDLQLQIFFN
ncbi:porin [Microbacter margulisiae]|uniref:Phosphate-selective porin n=1 Tax=Microbacter margulisiae TaxID=1350067 RepID=A0A7W5DQP0_9PORP|nr:porin [Microbacter margulisiae]MBB3186804.1 phosphate-selective porin [Microbacter margulisiae]